MVYFNFLYFCSLILFFKLNLDSERMMLELALQVVGMKLTGKLNDPKSIAMSIVNNNQESFKKALQYQKNKSPSDQTLQDCIINALHAISFIFNSNPLNLSLQNERGQTLLILSVILGYHNLTRVKELKFFFQSTKFFMK